MSREEFETGLKEIDQEELWLRRRLEELQDVTQNAPGSHRPGAPPAATIEAEREIQTVVLALSDLDRKRRELTVAMSIGR